MYKSEIAIILMIKEKGYQLYHKHKTKCRCILCKSKMRLLEIIRRLVELYIKLRTLKWVEVEYWGSDYSDFREYEVIGRQKVREPDGKGFQWPKTHYNHIRSVEVGAA